MAGIDFQIYITDEACTYARVASTNPGWYLTPKKWAISASSGECSPSRTTDSMYTPWVQQPFSGVYATGTNRLLHSLVIPPDAYAISMNIGEIYFIYEDYYGNEFLYAIAQPTSSIEFTPGVSQSYSFVFALNNTTVADTFVINYTYPQDIEDHNQREDAHDYLLARDGSRTATDVLKYANALTFSSDRDIVDKAYVDSLVTTIKKLINTTYCPPGSMMWWPKSTAPTGWLVRDGSSLSISAHPQLYKVLGTTYGGNGSSKFRLPDDRKLFIRGYHSDLDVGFGKIQSAGLPNIKGAVVSNDGSSIYSPYATGYLNQNNDFYSTGSLYILPKGTTEFNNKYRNLNIGGLSGSNYDRSDGVLAFNASRSSNIYKDSVSEVIPANRNYLPIIKDDD